MNCDRARRLFNAAWDDELTQAEREWLDAHFAGCARCRAEYDELSRVLEMAAALPRVEAAPDLLDRVLARTRRLAPAPDVVLEPPRRWIPAAVAAGAAVLAVAALFAIPLGPLRAPVPTVVPPAAAVVPLSGPAEPERVAAPAPAAARASRDVVFDPSKDVEFVLDPVTLHRGRATVTTGRRSETRGEPSLITF